MKHLTKLPNTDAVVMVIPANVPLSKRYWIPNLEFVAPECGVLSIESSEADEYQLISNTIEGNANILILKPINH